MKFSKIFHGMRSCAKVTVVIVLLTSIASCNKFLDTPLPTDKITGEGAYISDPAAGAVLTGILSKLTTLGTQSGRSGIGVQTGLYIDDLKDVSNDASSIYLPYYKDALTPSDGLTPWPPFYNTIYDCNLAISNLRMPKSPLIYRDQWLGEALFIRAQTFLNLTVLFGDVVLPTTPSATLNRSLPRASMQDAYSQITADLKEAQSLLSEDYKGPLGSVITNNRTRPNKFAATALLARIYLYNKDYSNAEIEASKIIGKAIYQMDATTTNFLATSKETIWALAPVGTNIVDDYRIYNAGMPAVIPANRQVNNYISLSLSDDLVGQFESGDTRFSNWVRQSVTSTVPIQTYYFPNKYKSSVNNIEHIVELRLAEQYLIRAEARARLNNLSGGKDDLTVVRSRAGLTTQNFSDQTLLLNAIMHERRVEFFSEFSHRFADLKRTETINQTMTAYGPKKSINWQPFMQFWPIPAVDIQVNSNLKQTAGY